MAISHKNYKRKDISLLLEDLKRLESHTEDLWHFLPTPVCLANPAFRIVNTSKALEETSGYKGIEITGEHLKDFLKDFEKIKKKLAKEKMLFGEEAIFLTRGKKEILVSLSAKTREDEKGEITGYFFAFIDMTEIRGKEKELQKRVQELEKLNKVTVGRELKMLELKKEISQLKKEIQVKR